VITIQAGENTGSESRTAIVTVKNTASYLMQELVVVQSANIAAYLELSIDSISLGAEANSSGSFGISCNSEWQISGVPDWINLSNPGGSGDAEISFSLQENPGPGSRTAAILISVSGEGISKTLGITQEAPGVNTLSLSASELQLTFAGGSTVTFSVISNTNWSISGVPDWLQADNTSGSGNVTIHLEATLNESPDERSALLTVSGTGGLTETILISQEGHPAGKAEQDVLKLKFYPNPAKETLYFSLAMGEYPLYYFIYSSSGRLVQEGRIETYVDYLEVGNLPEGMYHLRLYRNGNPLAEGSFLRVDR
jgi:hypothetical protein